MLTDPRLAVKLARARDDYGRLIFEPVGEVAMEWIETRAHLRRPPSEGKWRPARAGMEWGSAWSSAWFRGRAVVPEAAAGRHLFLHADTGAPEALWFLDGRPRGLFDGQNTTLYMGGNHHHALLVADARPGAAIDIAIEAYAGHPSVGSHPHDMTPEQASDPALFRRTYRKVELALRRDDVADFVFDLWTLLSLLEVLPEESLRHGRVIAGLAEVFRAIDQLPHELPESVWRPKLAAAREIMRPLLDAQNGTTAPLIGLTGHSHMDTAWHWTVDETIRKCARTYANALLLMEQYPEFRFIQSSVVHADMMRAHYPEIFEGISRAVRQGRWEPNGAMWVEPDCNMSSGEAFVRQFLIGQRTTRAWWGYTSDVFWLPDTFGYSAAMPQLMRGCGVKYFCTTKLSWNDTNRFPYDTFVWHGLDGTEVIAHFTMIHLWPTPDTMVKQWRDVQHKDVQDRRLLGYGFGDGGGGPQFEQIEIARRVEDLEGCPRSRHISAGEFMQQLEAEIGPRLPHWHGELYLELHRGTLTSVAATKKLNRQAELALRDAEMLCTFAAIEGAEYPHEELDTLWKMLLLNQFHDILPGSSIPEVNDEAFRDLTACVARARGMASQAAEALARPAEGRVTLFNTLSWDRAGEIALDGVPEDLVPADPIIEFQRVETVDGRKLLVIAGAEIPALGAAVLALKENASNSNNSPFHYSGNRLATPHAEVLFDGAGRISSLLDKASGRQLVAPGGALNTFLLGQDVPKDWDNWDIDTDQESKMREETRLVSREVAADGPIEFRIRSEYRIGLGSTLRQDMVFHASTPRIDFETVVDWSEKHVLLKASFATSIVCERARHEIQFGHVERPTHRNRPTDRAMFETCNHKWTDLSESGFGVALLNDCKYGVGVHRGTMALSLIKSGTHPDPRGDAGRHVFRYALLPHAGDFSVESVVRPAYEFNVAPVVRADGAGARASLLRVDAPNLVVETVKWAEKGGGAIVRLYEAEGTRTQTIVRLGRSATSAAIVNLLEEGIEPAEIADGGTIALTFQPFEIKSLRFAW